MSGSKSSLPVSDFDLRERVAIVTGASSGIGRATAIALFRRGATVALVDRNVVMGEDLASELNADGTERARFFAVDVSQPEMIERVTSEIVRDLGSIDMLAHCAGVQSYGSAVTTTGEAWQKTLAVDLDSAFFLAKAVLPRMPARGGAIVFIGSTQSVVANRNSAAYVTSKHAILGLMRSIALDFAARKIRCNCVLPGAIDTPMIRWGASQDQDPQRVLDACSSLALLKRMGTAEEVAHAVLFLLSDMASFITGTSLVVDGGQLVPCGGTAFQEIGTGAETDVSGEGA